MNNQTPDFLLAREATLIASDVAALMDDTQLSVAITYKEFVSKSFTPSTGTSTITYTSWALRAVRTSLSARELGLGPGVYQAGDIRYTFARSDLTISPQIQDQIVEGSDTYALVTWQTDPVSALWLIVARRVA